jgi:DNA-binding response OmpR family regulator
LTRYCCLEEKGQNTLRHILVIDDEDGIRKIVSLALSRHGITVTEAATGEAGLAMALTSHLDAIIVDLRLPDISGVEVAARYQSQGGTAPIILLSASDELEAMAEHPAIARSLSKPFTLSRLWSTVQGTLTPKTHGVTGPKTQSLR